MATKTRRRHEFFKEQKKGYNPDAIMIPDNALALRNNCKEGRWMLGETNYGDRLKLVAVKFSKYLHKGNEILAPGTPIGQLWFCPIDGGEGTDEQGEKTQLALNLVYYTILKNSKSGKSGSLLNFGQKAAQLEAQGYDYREIVWKPKFVSKSGTVINAAGQPEAASWYVLDWGFTLPEDQDERTYDKIGNLIDILSKTEEMDKLVDPLMLNEHECVDRLSPQEIVQLAASMNPLVPGIAAKSNNNDNAALPQSVVETAAF